MKRKKDWSDQISLNLIDSRSPICFVMAYGGLGVSDVQHTYADVEIIRRRRTLLWVVARARPDALQLAILPTFVTQYASNQRADGGDQAEIPAELMPRET